VPEGPGKEEGLTMRRYPALVGCLYEASC
jgi:hypothetical protein